MTKMMNRQEVAAFLGISVSTVDRLRRSSQLAYLQGTPNGKVWITVDAVQEYLARITRPANPVKNIKNTYRKRRV